ncbi:MAG: hypothetical protein ACYDCS_04190 [Candidatus Dormibacteria bacterium]
MKDNRAKPHVLVRALSERAASDHGKGVTILDLARMRRDARELRARARRAEQEAWLLARALDGALALGMLNERGDAGVEEAASA